MLARVPLALTISFYARTIDQQVQWPCRAFVGDGNGWGSLSLVQGAEVRDRPVQPNTFKKARYKPRRLPHGQPTQNFEGQAGPYGRVAISLLPSSSAGRRSLPHYLRIKPDRQRSALLQ